MDPRAFLRSIPEGVRPLLGSDLRDFRSGARWVVVQLWYGNRDVHYEAWHRAKLGTIEVGLHFEADDLTNARLLGAFRLHERAIRRRLPHARFEEWDKGWTRIWEPLDAGLMDEAVRDRVATVMARYITVLEPVLRDELPSDVPWSLPVPRKRSRVPRQRAPAPSRLP